MKLRSDIPLGTCLQHTRAFLLANKRHDSQDKQDVVKACQGILNGFLISYDRSVGKTFHSWIEINDRIVITQFYEHSTAHKEIEADNTNGVFSMEVDGEVYKYIVFDKDAYYDVNDEAGLGAPHIVRVKKYSVDKALQMYRRNGCNPWTKSFKKYAL